MSVSTSIVHSLPVNIDADGALLEVPKGFMEVGKSGAESESIFTAHLRGRKLFGKVLEMPPGSEAIIAQCESSHDLEGNTSSVRIVGVPVKKLVIWNTDAPSDVTKRIQSAFIWSKLNDALSK